jgi:hypothetical protein
MDDGRSMRAVKGSLDHSLKERYRESEGACSTRAVENRPGSPPKRETSKLGKGVARQLAWSLCSQSPHDEAVVARCAQWRPHQPPRRIRVKRKSRRFGTLMRFTLL